MQGWLGVRAQNEGQSVIYLTGGVTTPWESSGAPAWAEGASLAPEVCETGERPECASETMVMCRDTARGTPHA